MLQEEKQEDKEIRREIFGYKKEDVDRLLAELHIKLKAANEMQANQIKEINDLQNKLKTAESKIETLEAELQLLNNNKLSNNNNQRKDKEDKEDNKTYNLADIAILKAHLYPIASLDGTLSVWIFDKHGSIITYSINSFIDEEKGKQALNIFNDIACQLIDKISLSQLNMVFVDLDKLFLVFQKIDSYFMLGCICLPMGNTSVLLSKVSSQAIRIKDAIENQKQFNKKEV